MRFNVLEAFGFSEDGSLPILAEVKDKELNLQIDTFGKFMGSGRESDKGAKVDLFLNV